MQQTKSRKVIAVPGIGEVTLIRRAFSSMKQEEAVEKVLDLFCQTKDNADFIQYVEKVLPH